MDYSITLQINGDPYQVRVSPRQSLLDVLRFELELRGTHRGCDSGHCGSCTVLLKWPASSDASDEAANTLPQAVVSCLVLAVDADSCEVTTIEGLRQNGQLHPIQQSFINYGALQCGYCTSGMIMSAVALYEENPMPTEEEARQAIAGNLCRCTGYVKVVEAIMKAHTYG